MIAIWVLTLLGGILMCETVAMEMRKSMPELLVVTVATEETDGLRRLKRTTDAHDVRLNVFGMGEEWKGGNTRIEQVDRFCLSFQKLSFYFRGRS